MNAIKKLVISSWIASACSVLFAGWTSEGMIEKYKELPSELNILNEAETFYGKNPGGLWLCATVVTTDEGLSFHMTSDPETTTLVTFSQVLKFGQFDDIESLDKWLDQFIVKAWDEMEEAYVEVFKEGYAGDNIVEAWKAVFDLNKAKMDSVIQKIDAAWMDWLKKHEAEVAGDDGRGSGGGGAETIKKMDDALNASINQAKDQAEDLKKESEEVTEELKEAEIDLSKYNDERTQQASQLITEALSDFDAALADLDRAIESENLDALDLVNSGLDAVLSKIGGAVALIEGLQGEGYAESVEAMRSAMLVISQAKLDVQKTRDTGDWSHAKRARESLGSLNRLANIRKALAHAKIMLGRARGKFIRLGIEQNTILALIDAYELLRADFIAFRVRFGQHIVRYMTDMNTIGAYLGSTNAMAFFSSDRKVEKMEVEDLARWYKFSKPDSIDPSLGFGMSDIGGRKWKMQWDTLASIYGVYAFPYSKDDTKGFGAVMRMYNLNSMADINYNGFYSLRDDEDHWRTNWFARGITAPKNWADGKTIKVEDGKFVSGLSVKTDNPPDGAQYTEGSGRRLVFKSADDSNVKIGVTTNDVGDIEITIGVYYK